MSNETRIDLRSAINAQLEENALQFKYRRLAYLEETLREAGSSYGPEDLKKEAYEFNVLKDVADGIILRYENLIGDDSGIDDGDVPIRFVDYAHGEVVRLWTALSIELGKEIPVVTRAVESTVSGEVNEEGSINKESEVSGSACTVSSGKAAGIVVGVVAVGVIAGIALTLKNRKDANSDNRSVEKGDA